jgi:hypothetical protein
MPSSDSERGRKMRRELIKGCNWWNEPNFKNREPEPFGIDSAGVEFIDENGGGPGVRLRKRAQKRAGGRCAGEPNESTYVRKGTGPINGSPTSG